MEKFKSISGYSEVQYGLQDHSKPYKFNGLDTSTDPEAKRKKRVAGYNMYTVEGKLKLSLQNSFKWIKNKFSHH